MCAAQLEALQALQQLPQGCEFGVVASLSLIAENCPYLIGQTLVTLLQRMLCSNQVMLAWRGCLHGQVG